MDMRSTIHRRIFCVLGISRKFFPWKTSVIHLALLLTSVALPLAASAAQFTGQVGGLVPPDSRPCVFVSIVGVSAADPVIMSSSSWIAIPQSQNGFKETYALLLAAKLSGTPVTITTTGAAVPACDGYVGLANAYFPQ